VRSVEALERLIDRIVPFAQTNTSIIQSSPVRRRLPPLNEESATTDPAEADRPAGEFGRRSWRSARAEDRP
jgi:Lrp/AsnC family transcriptional regulator, leucine-responsive regulatory protein